MASFYIQSSDGVYELSATEQVSITESTSVTPHKLESGDTIVDNAVNNNLVGSFKGILSDVVSIPSGANDGIRRTNILNAVQTYLNGLRRVRARKELVTIMYDVGRFSSLTNCIITNLDITRTAATGTGYEVSLSFQQIRLTSKAKIQTTRSVQATPNVTQKKTESSGASTEETSIKSKPPVRTLSGSVLNAQLDGDE